MWIVKRWLAVAMVLVGCRTSDPSPAAPAKAAKPATVLLVVNLGEEDEEGGCGDIIHAVRGAATKGVHTREVDTRNASERDATAKKYRVLVQPAVIFLDASDHELRRYDGESTETIRALRADLDDVTKSR